MLGIEPKAFPWTKVYLNIGELKVISRVYGTFFGETSQSQLSFINSPLEKGVISVFFF